MGEKLGGERENREGRGEFGTEHIMGDRKRGKASNGLKIGVGVSPT